MTAIRYRVDGVPQWGTTAFSPVPAMTPTAATAGTQRRSLQQWTAAPNPLLESFAPGPPYDMVQQGSFANPAPLAFDKSHVPGAFIPSGPPEQRHFMQYWVSNGPAQGPNGTDTTMKIFSDNPVPVPAVNFARVTQPAMKQPPWATIVSTAWPRPFVTWPTWGSSRQM